MIGQAQAAMLANPQLAPGLLLLIGQLLREAGKTEITFNTDEYIAKYGRHGGIAVKITDDEISIKLTEGRNG